MAVYRRTLRRVESLLRCSKARPVRVTKSNQHGHRVTVRRIEEAKVGYSSECGAPALSEVSSPVWFGVLVPPAKMMNAHLASHHVRPFVRSTTRVGRILCPSIIGLAPRAVAVRGSS